MTDLGGPAWLELQQQRIKQLELDPSLRMVLQQTVVGASSATWHIIITDGTATIAVGAHPEPDVTLTADLGTVEEITEGRTSAQRAFLDGHLRIGGDIALLLAAREAISLQGPRGSAT